MNKFTAVFGAALAFCLYAAPGHAQATRTWVSGVGDDVNPCSRTAPCKTFAGAISKTAAGGEISVLDPGGFGAVTITKSVTINGDGTLAGILSALVNGVIINAAAADKIVLRNLSINGAGTGLNGIRLLAGGQLTVDNVTISGVTGNGIDVASTTGGELYVRDTRITRATTGIKMSTSAGFMVASIDNVRIDNMTTNGVETASANVFANVHRSIVANAGGAAIVASAGTGTINVDDSYITNNATAFSTSGVGSTIRINGNAIYNNTTGFNLGGGTIATAGNNKTAANGGAGVPNGAVGIQ